MEDMSKYYFNKEQINDQINLLDKYEQNSDEYRNQALKIIASYCKPLILTRKGISYGLELIEKWEKGEKLNRKELFDCYIMGPEAKLVTGGNGTYDDMAKLWRELQKQYKPEEEYLKIYIYEKLFPEGYMQQNPNFAKDINEVVKTYTENRPGLRAIFFTVDIQIMKE